jgi:hypothetical protein
MRKALWLKDAFVHGEPVSVAKMHAVRPSDIRAALMPNSDPSTD